MKFLQFFNLFEKRNEDKILFDETIKIYSKMNWAHLRHFLEEYARTCTERDVKNALTKNETPTYTTYHEIKKIIDFLDNVEKNFWQSKVNNIR